MPVTLSVITASFPDQGRSKAIGVWSAVAAGGGVLGMFLSALLVDVATWRWLFALPIALTLASTAISLRSVPNSREAAVGRFDLPGALTSIVAAVGFTYALHEARRSAGPILSSWSPWLWRRPRRPPSSCGSQVTSRLLARVTPRALLTPGMVLAGLGLWWLSGVGLDTS